MPATQRSFLQRLSQDFGDFYAWLITKPDAFAKVERLAQQYASAATGEGAHQYQLFTAAVKALRSYETWSSGGGGGETPPGEDTVPEPDWGGEPEPGDPGTPRDGEEPGPGTEPDEPDANLLATLTQFLIDNELPESLINFIRDALAKGKPYAQIIAELRQTPEYLAAYPENEMRKQFGLSWMPEAQIRAYRDEAKRLALDYFGSTASNAEIANLIARGTSLRLWEHRLQVNQLVKRYGAAVQQVFEEYTGSPLSEERLHAFMDSNFATPDLDRKYEMALRRGQPAELGFGIRPEEEAELLERFGIPVEQVFKGYQQIRSEIPRFERLAAIGQYLDQNGGDFFGDISVSGSLLFRAVQLGDPKAVAELQRRAAEETARFQATGGPARAGSGAFAGLEAR